MPGIVGIRLLSAAWHHSQETPSLHRQLRKSDASISRHCRKHRAWAGCRSSIAGIRSAGPRRMAEISCFTRLFGDFLLQLSGASPETARASSAHSSMSSLPSRTMSLTRIYGPDHFHDLTDHDAAMLAIECRGGVLRLQTSKAHTQA